MGTVTRAYSEVDGAIGEASSINRVIDDLYTLVNGNIDSANVGTCAIATVNLQDSAVTTEKLNDSAVTSDKIATNAITIGVLPLAEMNIFISEVF